MSEFKTVDRCSDLACLDGDEVVAGYRAGLSGVAEPGSTKSRSFWHGWRNGVVDSGRKSPDEAQRMLAADYCKSQEGEQVLHVLSGGEIH